MSITRETDEKIELVPERDAKTHFVNSNKFSCFHIEGPLTELYRAVLCDPILDILWLR